MNSADIQLAIEELGQVGDKYQAKSQEVSDKIAEWLELKGQTSLFEIVGKTISKVNDEMIKISEENKKWLEESQV